MEQKRFNDLTREFLEDFIAKLPKEDKNRLKEYIETHPRNTSSGAYAMIKSYIYNNYFRSIPQKNDAKSITFIDTISALLVDDENNEE